MSSDETFQRAVEEIREVDAAVARERSTADAERNSEALRICADLLDSYDEFGEVLLTHDDPLLERLLALRPSRRPPR